MWFGPDWRSLAFTYRYDLLIDGESKKSGSLFDDFEPPFNPPAEIDDPEETKPEDWVDTPKCVLATQTCCIQMLA